MEEKKLNLYQKILSVSSEVLNVQKNLTVGNANSKASYKAVSDYDVTLAVKVAEAKYGVVSIPVKQELVEHQLYESTDSYGNARTTFLDIIKMTVRIFDVENPSDYLEVESYGRGIDTGDKGFGKASTYARKYALLNVYKIATGEDPDIEISPANGLASDKPEGEKKPSAANKNTEKPITLDDVLKAISKAKNREELGVVYKANSQAFGKDPKFIKAINDQAQSFKK